MSPVVSATENQPVQSETHSESSCSSSKRAVKHLILVPNLQFRSHHELSQGSFLWFTVIKLIHLIIRIQFFSFCSLTIHTPKDELGLSGEHPQRGEQILHSHWARLALRGIPLQNLGVRRSSRTSVEGRDEGVCLQHPSARLRDRLLRPLFPRLAGAPLGLAAHPGIYPIAASGPARGI